MTLGFEVHLYCKEIDYSIFMHLNTNVNNMKLGADLTWEGRGRPCMNFFLKITWTLYNFPPPNRFIF